MKQPVFGLGVTRMKSRQASRRWTSSGDSCSVAAFDSAEDDFCVPSVPSVWVEYELDATRPVKTVTVVRMRSVFVITRCNDMETFICGASLIKHGCLSLVSINACRYSFMVDARYLW